MFRERELIACAATDAITERSFYPERNLTLKRATCWYLRRPFTEPANFRWTTTVFRRVTCFATAELRRDARRPRTATIFNPASARNICFRFDRIVTRTRPRNVAACQMIDLRKLCQANVEVGSPVAKNTIPRGNLALDVREKSSSALLLRLIQLRTCSS